MSTAETASVTAHSSSDPAVAAAPALLRGTARGLEILVTAGAPIEAIADAITARLAEAPSFFRGNDVRVRVDGGPLAPGSLARLDDIAGKFELRIVEVAAADAAVRPARSAPRDVPTIETWPAIPGWPTGSAPVPVGGALETPAGAEPALGVADEHGAVTATPDQPSLPLPEVDAPPVATPPEPPVARPGFAGESIDAPTAEQLELALRALEPTIEVIEPEPEPEPSRIVIGPVRSGVILEHRGHLIIFGDVNPGAEVRAEGNIIVLGRLRGTAHAGIGAPAGFILALRLQPQQLRIGRTVARASDSETPGTEPEIAHVTGGTIVVERYTGRLPSNLAASI